MSTRIYPNKIKEIQSIGVSLGVEDLTNYVLNIPDFDKCTGSLENKHHDGIGGLQYHTWEVIYLSLNNGKHFEGVDPRKLFLAALYHDVGKIWDYKNIDYGVWVASEHKRTIHHISRSALEWNNACRLHRYRDTGDNILHCILSHHGQREWGSPVAPKTKEAWILFLCDGLSARVDDCDRVDLQGKVKNI
jgi:3'-5' exoribonuclease